MINVLSFQSIKNIPINQYLSKKEIDLYNNILPIKKEDWLIGIFNIKKVVSEYFLDNFNKKITAREIELFPKKLKKPVVKIGRRTDNRMNVSISHRDGFALGAIAENKKEGLVGVDIEKIRSFKPKFLKEYLLPDELKFIKATKLFSKPFLATLFWSIKESYLKAIGTGLIYHPKNIKLEINFENNTCKLYDKNKKIFTKINWKVFRKKYLVTKVNIYE